MLTFYLNLSYGNPKSYTCQTCDQLQNLINVELNLDIKLSLFEEKQMYQKKKQKYFILISNDYHLKPRQLPI